MKSTIVTLTLILVSLSSAIYSQTSDSTRLSNRNMRLGLSTTFDPFFRGKGVIAKAEMKTIELKHLDAHLGIAFQYSQINETNRLLAYGIRATNHDLGLNLTLNLNYYPLKSKTIFLGLEPFIGVTNLRSNGELSLPNINEFYQNDYTYMNYGFSPMLGYDFGKFSTNIFSMISLKGLLDDGRNRLGDMDSRILLGINLSYQLK